MNIKTYIEERINNILSKSTEISYFMNIHISDEVKQPIVDLYISPHNKITEVCDTFGLSPDEEEYTKVINLEYPFLIKFCKYPTFRK